MSRQKPREHVSAMQPAPAVPPTPAAPPPPAPRPAALPPVVVPPAPAPPLVPGFPDAPESADGTEPPASGPGSLPFSVHPSIAMPRPKTQRPTRVIVNCCSVPPEPEQPSASRARRAGGASASSRGASRGRAPGGWASGGHGAAIRPAVRPLGFARLDVRVRRRERNRYLMRRPAWFDHSLTRLVRIF